jgi:hypothetical protein
LHQKCEQMLNKIVEVIVKRGKDDMDSFCEPIGRYKLKVLNEHQHADYVKFIESDQFHKLSHTIVLDICKKLLKKEVFEPNEELCEEIHDSVYEETKILFLMNESTIKGNQYFNQTMPKIIQNHQHLQKYKLAKKSAEEKNKLMTKKAKDDEKKKKLEDPKRICYKDSAGIMHYSKKK